MLNIQHLLEGFQELPFVKKAMEDLLAAHERITAEGEAGGGLVRARANGQMVLTSIEIAEELLSQPDRELLEELVLAACNQALERVRMKISEQALENLTRLPEPLATSHEEEPAMQAANQEDRSCKSANVRQGRKKRREHDQADK
ncbi:MAG: YbaB/EbfC family nucleoid-associated protein [Gemmatales bacterium]|nr:YbaB/EbfC family nucleoid-associated protein [Gemmatales bacterium]MDW8174083.1 YbaB/EbfC family nucleoid-associated protein [Gemmatales bacterium]